MIQARVLLSSTLREVGNQFERAERALNQLENPVLVYHAAKLAIPIVMCGLAALAISALWQFPYVLGVLLVAIAFVKHKLFPIKLEVLWFVGVAALGAYAEALIIDMSGAWTYANWQFAQIPVWLPAIWGLVGISLMTAYAAVTEPMPAARGQDLENVSHTAEGKE